MSSATMQLLESMNHSPVKEFRVNEGRVESRVVDFGLERNPGWREVSAAQLSSHVKRNTKCCEVVKAKLGLEAVAQGMCGPGVEPKLAEDVWLGVLFGALSCWKRNESFA